MYFFMYYIFLCLCIVLIYVFVVSKGKYFKKKINAIFTMHYPDVYVFRICFSLRQEKIFCNLCRMEHTNAITSDHWNEVALAILLT